MNGALQERRVVPASFFASILEHTSPFHSQGRREGMDELVLRDSAGNADLSICANGLSWSLCTTGDMLQGCCGLSSSP